MVLESSSTTSDMAVKQIWGKSDMAKVGFEKSWIEGGTFNKELTCKFTLQR